MKIRADFVTNSSSSSFVTISVTKKNGEIIQGELEASDPIDANTHNGCLHLEKEVFENAESLISIVQVLADWLYKTMEEPDCGPDEYEEIVSVYGSDELQEIMKIRTSDVAEINISSEMEFWDEPWGASTISYDYTKNQLSQSHDPGESQYSMDEADYEGDWEEEE